MQGTLQRSPITHRGPLPEPDRFQLRTRPLGQPWRPPVASARPGHSHIVQLRFLAVHRVPNIATGGAVAGSGAQAGSWRLSGSPNPLPPSSGSPQTRALPLRPGTVQGVRGTSVRRAGGDREETRRGGEGGGGGGGREEGGGGEASQIRWAERLIPSALAEPQSRPPLPTVWGLQRPRARPRQVSRAGRARTPATPPLPEPTAGCQGRGC